MLRRPTAYRSLAEHLLAVSRDPKAARKAATFYEQYPANCHDWHNDNGVQDNKALKASLQRSGSTATQSTDGSIVLTLQAGTWHPGPFALHEIQTALAGGPAGAVKLHD